MRRHSAYAPRRQEPSGPESLDLGDDLAARRLGIGVSKSLRGAPTEVWAVHPYGDPGASVLQVELYKPFGQPWAAWTGATTRARDRELAQRVAVARNGAGHRSQ